MTTNTTPALVRVRQKAEIDALRKSQAAERKVLNVLGELDPDAARSVLARVAMAFAPVDSMAQEIQ